MKPKIEVKKTPEERASRKAVEEVAEGTRRVHSPLSLMASSKLTVLPPLIRSRKTNGDKSSKGLGITKVLTSIMQKIERVEEKVDQVDERLGQLEQSCSEMHASISIMKTVIESSITRTV